MRLPRTSLRPYLAAVLAALAGVGVALAATAAQGQGPTITAGYSFPAPAPPPPAPVAPYGDAAPTPHPLYADGPSGRYLLGGTWLFRRRGRDLPSSHSLAGWQRVSVPFAWNADDSSLASFVGAPAWYRRDFRLPSSNRSLTWIVRFESVNYRSTVWLNGHRIGSHTGEFLPFEFELPARYLNHRGSNRLVVLTNSRHNAATLPPFYFSSLGTPFGGYWNYAGILREVYVRAVQRIDMPSVQVLPFLPVAGGPATIRFRVIVRNYGGAASTHVLARFGGALVSLGTHKIRAGGDARFSGSLRVAHPHLWTLADPYLYNVGLSATATNGGHASYSLHSGIRSLRVTSGGILLLNGVPVHLRGVGLQEDALGQGFAIDNATRARFIADVKDVGATLIRSQYPLHPEMEELADREGILLWSEVPVFTVQEPTLDQASFRHNAIDYLDQNILDNGNHPSVGIWSIGNELSPSIDFSGGERAYVRDAAASAHGLDPTRPVGIALQGYPKITCQSSYGSLQVLGINDYFGWYPGPTGQIADDSLLSPYLDQARACYPHQALMVTEFGAEANRDGPVEERGTYEYQSAFVNYHLSVFATKPWLAAAVYWALEEFKVRPGWGGGDPEPQPPIHNKGLVGYTGFKKPAYYDIQRIYRATKQVG